MPHTTKKTVENDAWIQREWTSSKRVKGISPIVAVPLFQMNCPPFACFLFEIKVLSIETTSFDCAHWKLLIPMRRTVGSPQFAYDDSGMEPSPVHVSSYPPTPLSVHMVIVGNGVVLRVTGLAAGRTYDFTTVVNLCTTRVENA